MLRECGDHASLWTAGKKPSIAATERRCRGKSERRKVLSGKAERTRTDDRNSKLALKKKKKKSAALHSRGAYERDKSIL